MLDDMTKLLKLWIDTTEKALNVATSHGCVVSVIGNDFRIYEPTQFDPKWPSLNFHGPGLRNEIGICIASELIVWAHGQFPCGSFPDLKIFMLAMKNA